MEGGGHQADRSRGLDESLPHASRIQDGGRFQRARKITRAGELFDGVEPLDGRPALRRRGIKGLALAPPLQIPSAGETLMIRHGGSRMNSAIVLWGVLAGSLFATDSQAIMALTEEQPYDVSGDSYYYLQPDADPYYGSSSGGTWSAPAYDRRCQSSSLCVFASMPLYYQQDYALEQYIREHLGVYDPGLCVPTANAMVMGGILTEFSGTRAPWLGTFESDWDYRQRIFETGMKMDTDFADGGTYLGSGKGLLQWNSLLSSGATKNKTDIDGIGPFDNTHPSTADFISKIRADKYAYIVSMDARSRHSNFWGTSWKWEAGHGLAINGFDRDALKIYDPWAEIYFVRLHIEHLKYNGVGFGKDRSVVDIATDVGGNDWGFVKYEQGNGYKVILDEYMGWSID
jgi:hypothetical protein